MQPRPMWRTVVGAVVVGLVVAGCGSDGGGDDDGGTDRVRVGLVASVSGPYQAVGQDLRDGFELYVELNDGMLGGRPAEVLVADEGLGAADARPATERLIRQDQVDALTGIVNSDTFLAVHQLAVAQGVPIIGSNARPTSLQGSDLDWVWTTSQLNTHSGRAIAPYIDEHVDGPVWAIGPDNLGGVELLEGFTTEFTELGGELANPAGETTFVPYPDTNNFVQYLSEIAASDAAAIYAFFGGALAIDFVTQWAQSPAADIPLYGLGLTEGAVLEAQGEAAEGVHTVLNYSPDLANIANQRFVSEWSSRYDRTPTIFAMASYDAAQVLDMAVTRLDDEVTPAAINEAIGALGLVASPRGAWEFSEVSHAPVQQWYLREVAREDGRWANVVVEDLAIVGD